MPHQQMKKKHILLDILILIFAAVAAISAVYLIQQMVIYPNQNTSAMQNVQKIYHQQLTASYLSENASATGPVSSASPTTVKNTLSNLKKLNSDIVGWVQYPETVIDYPVVTEPTESPDFYLHHNYLKEDSNHGSIFLPKGTSPVTAKSLLLYGHNMKDGQMFHCIAELTLDQLKQQPLVYFDTGSGAQAYKIFAYLKTNTQSSQGKPFNYTAPKLQTNSDFLQFGYDLAIRSIYRFPVDVRAGDQLLLFSTCSYEFSDFRSVLAARRVRTEESNTVDSSAITQSTKPLYPDCWYVSHGETKPNWPATYTEAAKKKELPWPVA